MGKHAAKRYPWYSRVPWPDDMPLWMLLALALLSVASIVWGVSGIVMEVANG